MTLDSDLYLVLVDLGAHFVRSEIYRALPRCILFYHACGLGPFLGEQPIYIFQLQTLGLGEEDIYDGNPRS